MVIFSSSFHTLVSIARINDSPAFLYALVQQITPPIYIMKQQTFIISHSFWEIGIWEWLAWVVLVHGFS